MELEDVESDILALRKLYGLLQCKGNVSQSASSENLQLDEKARIFLKTLLDGATRRVFGAYSKLVAAKSGVCDAAGATQWAKLKGMPMLWPPVSPDAAKPSPIVAQRSSKVPSCNLVTPYDKTKTPIKLTTQVIGSESSMLNSSATEPEKIKRHCRVSQESCMKQPESTEKQRDSHEKTKNPKLANISLQNQPKQSSRFQWDKGLVSGLDLDRQGIESMSNVQRQQQGKIRKIQPKLSGLESLDYYPIISAGGFTESGAIHDLGRKTGKKPDKADYVSNEPDDAIRQIELCISTLQQVAEHVGPLENSASLHGSIEMVPDSIPGIDSVSPLMQMEQGIGKWSELSRAREVASGIDNLSKEMSQRVWKSNNLSQLPQVQNWNLKPGDVGKPVSKGHGKSNWRASHITGQHIKVIGEKIESPSTLLSQDCLLSGHGHKYVQGLRVPESRAKLSYVTPALLTKSLSQIEMENRDQNLMPQKEPMRKVGRYRSSNLTVSLGSKGLANRKIQVVDADHKLSGTKTKGATRREKVLPHQMIIRSPLPDPKCSQFLVSPTLDENWMSKEQVYVEKNSKNFAHWKKILPYRQGSEDMSLSSHASSSWTSQQAGISSSDSEEYLLRSHRPRGQRFMCPANSTDSEGYLLPSHESGGLHMGLTSSSESMTHPLPSGTSSGRSTRPSHHKIGPFSSSESEGYTPPNRVQADYRMALSSRLAGSKSTRSVPYSKNFRSGNQRTKPKKQIGHLRRVKDKLALIFHHHHHHHHHHDGQDHSDKKTRVAGGGASLMKKHAGKIIHGRNRNSEAYGEQAAEKLTKSVIRKVPDKNQHRHYHDLVEGLLRHVRNSRKSKPSKGSIKQAGISHHSSKKTVKKLHWWKMFRHQRAVKLPSKPHAKLGFKSKKH